MKFNGRSLIKAPISSLSNAFLIMSILFSTRKFFPFILKDTISPYRSFHFRKSRWIFLRSMSKKEPKKGKPHGPGGDFFFLFDVMTSKAVRRNQRNDKIRDNSTSIVAVSKEVNKYMAEEFEIAYIYTWNYTFQEINFPYPQIPTHNACHFVGLYQLYKINWYCVWDPAALY